MGIISRGFRKIGFCFATITAKIRWNAGIKVVGLFEKRRDTQIIISEGGKLNLKKNVSFQRNVSLTSAGGVLNIGENVAFNRNCIVICRKEITIEDNVIFGPNVTIYDHDHIFTSEGIQSGYRHGAVIIEKGCWIGANVTILKNTHIGEGCVIGAGTVIKGDIPQHSLVTGDRSLNIVPIEKKS